MKIYERPFAKVILAQEFSIPAFAQSGDNFTLNFGPCSAGPSIQVEDGQFEGCFEGNPSGKSFSFQCAETGTSEYIGSIENAVPGSIPCGNGDSPFLAEFTVSGDVPSVCTVTRSIGADHCDECSNTSENSGAGNCGDGIDNDCDGAFDQGDFNCAG